MSETTEDRCESTIVMHQNWSFRCQRSTNAHAVHETAAWAEGEHGKVIEIGIHW